jgi:hypothetical protein
MMLLAAGAIAQGPPGPQHRRPPTAPPDNTKLGPWRAAKGSPLNFAKLGDASLNAYRNIEGRTTVLLNYDGYGRSDGEIEVRDPQVFRMDYTWLHDSASKKDYPITRNTLIANGRSVDLTGAQPKHRQLQESSFRFNTSRNLQDWALGCPRFILGSIHGEHALTSLVSKALASPESYRVSFQTRDVVNKGVPGRQMRTSIDRLPAAAKSQGAFHLEVICDPKYGIPVEMEIRTTLPGQKEVGVTWYAGWRKVDKFPDKDFQFSLLKLANR